MGIISEISQSDLANFLTHDDTQISKTSLRARFNVISLILRDINRLAPAPKDDPLAPLCPKRFELHIQALVKLAKSIRLSEKFDKAQARIVGQTLNRISEDRRLVRRLEDWSNSSSLGRKKTLGLLDRKRTDSARDVLKLRIKAPEIILFETPRNEQGRLSLGFFGATLKTRKSGHTIRVNEHENTKFDDVYEALSTLYHEGGGHGTQFELAWHYKYGNRYALRQFETDAQVIALQYEFGAIISNRIREPYYAQCHEVDAYKQEALFKVGLNQIISSPRPANNEVKMAAKCG